MLITTSGQVCDDNGPIGWLPQETRGSARETGLRPESAQEGARAPKASPCVLSGWPPRALPTPVQAQSCSRARGAGLALSTILAERQRPRLPCHVGHSQTWTRCVPAVAPTPGARHQQEGQQDEAMGAGYAHRWGTRSPKANPESFRVEEVLEVETVLHPGWCNGLSSSGGHCPLATVSPAATTLTGGNSASDCGPPAVTERAQARTAGLSPSRHRPAAPGRFSGAAAAGRARPSPRAEPSGPHHRQSLAIATAEPGAHLLEEHDAVPVQLVLGEDVATGRDPEGHVVHGLRRQQELLGPVRLRVLDRRTSGGPGPTRTRPGSSPGRSAQAPPAARDRRRRPPSAP